MLFNSSRFMIRFCLLIVSAGGVLIAHAGCGKQVQNDSAIYGQHPPGLQAVEFLPEVISDMTRPHSALCFSLDGREMYVSGYVIGEGRDEWMFTSKREGNSWTAPEKVTFNGGQGNGPSFSPDGARLYFGAKRPLPGQDGPAYGGIWFVDRTPGGWSEPQPIDVTLDSTWFAGRPTVTKSGTLYFVAMPRGAAYPMIHKCMPMERGFSKPEPIPGPINDGVAMDPYVDPDERFILMMSDVNRNIPGYGISDVYISHPQADGTWGEPVNLGPTVNTKYYDRSPSLSRDGKYLFFIRAVGRLFVEADASYYWISAAVLDSLKN